MGCRRGTGGRILSGGDSKGAPGYIQLTNIWLIVNAGGGPTPEKPSVRLSVPDPDKMSGFMKIHVADIKRAMSYAGRPGIHLLLTLGPDWGADLAAIISINKATTGAARHYTVPHFENATHN